MGHFTNNSTFFLDIALLTLLENDLVRVAAASFACQGGVLIVMTLVLEHDRKS